MELRFDNDEIKIINYVHKEWYTYYESGLVYPEIFSRFNLFKTYYTGGRDLVFILAVLRASKKLKYEGYNKPTKNQLIFEITQVIFNQCKGLKLV